MKSNKLARNKVIKVKWEMKDYNMDKKSFKRNEVVKDNKLNDWQVNGMLQYKFEKN